MTTEFGLPLPKTLATPASNVSCIKPKSDEGHAFDLLDVQVPDVGSSNLFRKTHLVAPDRAQLAPGVVNVVVVAIVARLALGRADLIGVVREAGETGLGSR